MDYLGEWFENLESYTLGTKAYAVATGKHISCRLGPRHFHFKPNKTRGRITAFSRASRVRMLALIAKIDWPKITDSTFVTLTYPDDRIAVDLETRTKQRYLYMRYTEKYLQVKVPTIWRLEWKARRSGKRKGEIVPHLHLLQLGVKYVPKKLVREWWGKILGWKEALATHIEKVESGEVASLYVAKYLGKVAGKNALDYNAYLNSSGRHWGVSRKMHVPMGDQITFPDLDVETVIFLKNFAADVIPGYDPRLGESFQIFGNKAVELQEYLQKKKLDKTGETS